MTCTIAQNYEAIRSDDERTSARDERYRSTRNTGRYQGYRGYPKTFLP